jgi:hypothetical protein
MTLILPILLGLIAGQYIKLTVDPKAIEMLRRAWAWLKDLDILGAIEQLRMGPLETKVARAFQQLETEVEQAKQAEQAKGKPAAIKANAKEAQADG